MTQFEKLLQNTKIKREILYMQSCSVDNLTENEIITLKAKYLGVNEDTVRFILAGSSAVKKENWSKLLKQSQGSIIAVIA